MCRFPSLIIIGQPFMYADRDMQQGRIVVGLRTPFLPLVYKPEYHGTQKAIEGGHAYVTYKPAYL